MQLFATPREPRRSIPRAFTSAKPVHASRPEEAGIVCRDNSSASQREPVQVRVYRSIDELMKSVAPGRIERLAAALRQNLKRRKARERAIAAGSTGSSRDTAEQAQGRGQNAAKKDH
jgi:hypothetical protein